MAVRLMETAADAARWDAFVADATDATFFHRSGWKTVIERSFGHRTHFLFAERDGVITGVLPLAEVRSWLFGHTLVSLPFCVYGGVAATDDASSAELVAAAGNLAERLGTDFLELRQCRAVPDLPVVERYVTFRRELDPDPDKNMAAIPRKQRAMIRKGAAKGLVTRIVPGVDGFFGTYADSLRNLGTPVLPLRYFAMLKQVFGEHCEVLEVLHEEEVVAAVMTFYFRDQVLPYYGGGTAMARETHAYDFMYWDLLVHALGRGCRVFDFGRSRIGTGSYRFKTHWGFEPTPLPYQYRLVRAAALPNKTPDNPRYAPFIKAWQRLPLRLTTLIGPWLARSLG